MIVALHHVHLICGDPDKTAAFFKDTFGAEELYRGILGGNAFVRIGLKGLTINITQTVDPQAGCFEPGIGKRGLDHISFKIDDMEKVLKIIEEKELTIIKGPAFSETGSHYVFIEGPEKMQIELMKPKAQ